MTKFSIQLWCSTLIQFERYITENIKIIWVNYCYSYTAVNFSRHIFYKGNIPAEEWNFIVGKLLFNVLVVFFPTCVNFHFSDERVAGKEISFSQRSFHGIEWFINEENSLSHISKYFIAIIKYHWLAYYTRTKEFPLKKNYLLCSVQNA